ncbi:TrpB-like pyridoxal phosphate-dependent enzyme [Actinokineospora terrae]|uniref:Tryptophan synthase beta chain n=1 Tax=Actinokineospora terrae TaxID=155974 RepID=A0A1H9KHV6_9PSEU|nr:TrpB-like pyridoxal phosphate-dependent enzyme [Actinokineospora terrae]SEQ98659.1 tryptophan synthase beta chain [Actinokineospora terrae]
MNDRVRFSLSAADIPRAWYNLAADLPDLAPPRHPASGRAITSDDLLAIVPEELARQELTLDREVEIPEPVRQIYARWRPSPLIRARGLERSLGTPARIYYKYEGVSPTGSHKPNTAIAQAYYNKQAGITKLATETGAGQWGSSLALAGALFGLDISVYMVRLSFDQKPYRQMLMQTYGARCVASPSTETETGRAILARDPDSPGSLGIAASEAVEIAANDPTTNYAGGSVLNHVLLHQTVIGQEAIVQFAMADDYPDVVVGCAGGGSNLGGLAFPFLGAQLSGGRPVHVIAAEPASCPSMTQGTLAYDFGDTAGFTPLLRMYTLGHGFIPPPLQAGGLRYHGMAPLVSEAVAQGLIDPVAVAQTACFAAGVRFARTEGIVPAPESTHAVEVAIREALRCREEGVSRTILFGLSGHGHFDLGAYEDYLSGTLRDGRFEADKMTAALAELPDV